MHNRPVTPKATEKFWKFVDTTTANGGCWLWQGTRTPNGYGRFGETVASRYSYALHTGSYPPAGQYVCHTCDTPLCVNPAHLFAGTSYDNMRDCLDKGRIRAQKLSREDVKAILEALAAKKENHATIAARFGVQKAAISKIKLGTSWKHIEPSAVGRTVDTAQRHCVHGHSLDDALIERRRDGSTYRRCRECRRLRWARPALATPDSAASPTGEAK